MIQRPWLGGFFVVLGAFGFAVGVVRVAELVEETYTEDRIEGYRVTYEYMGRRYATVMPEPPRGDRVRLHVTVEAAGY